MDLMKAMYLPAVPAVLRSPSKRRQRWNVAALDPVTDYQKATEKVFRSASLASHVPLPVLKNP
jgi:hypothetical protein